MIERKPDMDYLQNAKDITNALINSEGCKLSQFEAMQIAVQIQRNELYAQAHALSFGANADIKLEPKFDGVSRDDLIEWDKKLKRDGDD